MKLSRIIPESPRLKTAVAEPVNVKSKVQLRAQAYENESAAKAVSEALEESGAIAKSSDPGLIEDIVSIRSEAKDRNFAETKKPDFDSPAAKSSGYKNPIQKVKADKIEEMSRRFFLSSGTPVKNPVVMAESETPEVISTLPKAMTTPREGILSAREENPIPLET